jgi:hypothetical protein
MMGVRTTLLIAALVMPALSGAAFGADIPGNKGTNAKLPVVPGAISAKTGTFEIAGDSDWYKVELKKGEWYAFGFDGSNSEGFSFHARLRNPAGNVLVGDIVIPELEDNGLIFKAKRTGRHYVEVKHNGGDVQTMYRLWANIDCPGGFNPECKITVDVERKSVLTWHDDTDSFGVQLQQGKTYQLALESIASGINGYVYDPSNTQVAFDGQPFTAASTGRYIVLVDTNADNGAVYKITLSEVPAPPVTAAR